MMDTNDTESSAKRVQSMKKLFTIVDTLCDAESAGVSELAERLEMAKSTVHVHLKTLEEEGYLVRADPGRTRPHSPSSAPIRRIPCSPSRNEQPTCGGSMTRGYSNEVACLWSTFGSAPTPCHMSWWEGSNRSSSSWFAASTTWFSSMYQRVRSPRPRSYLYISPTEPDASAPTSRSNSPAMSAKVRGYQGDGVGDPEGVVATAKHFPAYSEPERGEDASPVDVSEYKLRNTFLPPFERALAAGVESVMPSHNSTNGEPAHGSPAFLRDLLRVDLEFEGHVVFDWNGIRHLHADHGTARDHAGAVRQAREAGVDVASVGAVPHADRIVELVEAGELAEATLDRSVERVFRI